MGEYTMNMFDYAHDIARSDDLIDNYGELIDFLNSPNFRSFGESLEMLIRSKMPSNCQLTPQKYLERCCKEKNIHIAAKSTFRNWFVDSMRPDKGSASRAKMFALSFALDLNTDETKKLFHEVFLDRAYNPRNYHELIYYYCLKNKKTFAHAQNLISLVSLSHEANDKTVYTAAISQDIDNINEDLELIEYIESHPHNFSINNKSAYSEYQKQWEKARLTVDKELGFPNRKTTEEPRMRNDWDSGRTASFYHKDINSAAFDYEIITGQSITKTSANGTRPLSFKNAELPKEIKNNFPACPTVDENVPYEQLRKMIILLFSYTFWYNVQTYMLKHPTLTGEDTEFFYDYRDQLDALLETTGYPPLYFGNPFDWLFLACAHMDYPLDAFREILNTVLRIKE